MAKKGNLNRIARMRYSMLPDSAKLDITEDGFALLKKHGFPTEGADVYGKEYERLMKCLKKSRSTLYTRIEDHPDEHKMIIWNELVVNGCVRDKTQHRIYVLSVPEDGGEALGEENTADTQ